MHPEWRIPNVVATHVLLTLKPPLWSGRRGGASRITHYTPELGTKHSCTHACEKGCRCLWDHAALAHSLHNPNIRADRRTTLDAFLHTNRNYGKEVSRGQSLPDSLLTSLYSTCGYS